MKSEQFRQAQACLAIQRSTSEGFAQAHPILSGEPVSQNVTESIGETDDSSLQTHPGNRADRSQVMPAEVESKPETCPKCHTTTPWRASSWCPECGYYPGIAEGISEVVEEEEVVEVSTEQPPLVQQWVTRSIAGPSLLFAFGIGANYYFTYWGGDRGLVSLILLLVGALTFMTAHFKAFLALLNDEPTATPFDMVAKPVETWRSTIRGLPGTGNRIAIACSGIAAVAVALFVIGGIDLNSLFEKEKVEEEETGIVKRMMTGMVQHAPQPVDEDPPETMEEALNNLAPIVEELEAASLALLPPADQPLTCVVYGFLRDGDDDARLLLASEVMGARVHVGTMKMSELPTHVQENLASRLGQLITDERAVESKYHGTWVRPAVGFKVDFESWSMNGELTKPTIAKPKEKKKRPALPVN